MQENGVHTRMSCAYGRRMQSKRNVCLRRCTEGAIFIPKARSCQLHLLRRRKADSKFQFPIQHKNAVNGVETIQ